MGSLVGIDEDKDIAVLKIDVPKEVGVHPLKLGSSSDLLVGQRVFAIGNPFGVSLLIYDIWQGICSSHDSSFLELCMQGVSGSFKVKPDVIVAKILASVLI